MRPTLLVLPLLFMLGCSSGVELQELRCQNSCQENENPLVLLLEVDFEDLEGLLESATLEVKVDELPAIEHQIRSLQNSPGLASGVLKFRCPLPYSAVQDGQKMIVTARVVSGDWTSDETSLELVVKL